VQLERGSENSSPRPRITSKKHRLSYAQQDISIAAGETPDSLSKPRLTCRGRPRRETEGASEGAAVHPGGREINVNSPRRTVSQMVRKHMEGGILEGLLIHGPRLQIQRLIKRNRNGEKKKKRQEASRRFSMNFPESGGSTPKRASERTG